MQVWKRLRNFTKLVTSRLFLLYIIFRKEVNEMALVYAWLIIEGKREFKTLNPRIKPKVKAALTDLGFPELAEEGQE